MTALPGLDSQGCRREHFTTSGTARARAAGLADWLRMDRLARLSRAVDRDRADPFDNELVDLFMGSVKI